MPKIIENLHERIVAETGILLQENGVEGVSIRAISQRLQIAPATIYNYFSSKEQILGAVMLKRWQMFTKEAEKLAASPSGDVLLDLITLSEQLKSFMHPSLTFWLMEGSMAAEHMEHIIEKKQIVFSQLTLIIEKLLRQAGHEEQLIEDYAHSLVALIILCNHNAKLDLRNLVMACRSL